MVSHEDKLKVIDTFIDIQCYRHEIIDKASREMYVFIGFTKIVITCINKGNCVRGIIKDNYLYLYDNKEYMSGKNIIKARINLNHYFKNSS
jgi:hypothetical protein